MQNPTARLIAICAAAHLAAAFIAGAIAVGRDFDQLRSRSAMSIPAGYIHDVLMGPHGMVIRAIPNRWLVQRTIPLIPIWLVLHSLFWGLAIAVLITWHRSRTRRQSGQGS